MRKLISSRCLVVVLGVAALVTSMLRIDRLQQRVENLESENMRLKEEVRSHEDRERREKETSKWERAMELLKHD